MTQAQRTERCGDDGVSDGNEVGGGREVIVAAANRIAAAAVTARVPASACPPLLSYPQQILDEEAVAECHSVLQLGSVQDHRPPANTSGSFDASQLLCHSYRNHILASRLRLFTHSDPKVFTLVCGMRQAP